MYLKVFIALLQLPLKVFCELMFGIMLHYIGKLLERNVWSVLEWVWCVPRTLLSTLWRSMYMLIAREKTLFQSVLCLFLVVSYSLPSFFELFISLKLRKKRFNHIVWCFRYDFLEIPSQAIECYLAHVVPLLGKSVSKFEDNFKMFC